MGKDTSLQAVGKVLEGQRAYAAFQAVPKQLYSLEKDWGKLLPPLRQALAKGVAVSFQHQQVPPQTVPVIAVLKGPLRHVV